MPTPAAYSKTQIILHWLIVLAVTFQYVAHDSIETLWNGRMRGTIPNEPVPDIHVAMGIVILLLMIWRIWLRVSHGAPALPENDPKWARILSQSVQGLLYLSLIALPLTGMVAWFAGIGPAAGAHGLLKNVMLALLALHVGGALVQHFVFRTDVLKRMTGRA